MLAIAGWTIAGVMTFLLLVIQWSWGKHAAESLAQSEFIAALFIDPIIYENSRKVYMPWVDGLPKEIEVGEVMAASQGARNIATSYIGKLGQVVGLRAILTDYKSLQHFDTEKQ